MSAFENLVDELERYARTHRGCFLLPGTQSGQKPPESLMVLYDFDVADLDVAGFVRSRGRKHGFTSEALDWNGLSPFVREYLSSRALVLFGSSVDEHGNWIGSDEHFRKQFPDLIPADVEVHCKFGWIGILERYFEQVREILPNDVGFELLDACEKLGMLDISWRTRLSLDQGIERLLTGAAALALLRSIRSCEVCGDPGSLVKEQGGRVFTACEPHAVGAEPVRVSGPVFLRGLPFEYDPTTDGLTEGVSE